MKNALFIISFLCITPIYSQWDKFSEVLNNNLLDIEAIESGDKLFVVGTDLNTMPSSGIIYNSIDGGINWDTVYYQEVDSLLGILYRVNIIDSNIAYVTNAGNRVFKSIDGGSSWSTLNLPTLEAGPATDAVYFINSEIGFIGNYYGEIFKTIDGGVNWELVHFLQPYTPIYDINCPTIDTCYARSSIPSFLKSIDGGNTWNAVSSAPNTTLLGGMHVINKDTIVMVSSDALIFRTINGGEHWDTITSPINAGFLDVQFIDSIGFAVGRKEAIIKSCLLYTSPSPRDATLSRMPSSA